MPLSVLKNGFTPLLKRLKIKLNTPVIWHLIMLETYNFNPDKLRVIIRNCKLGFYRINTQKLLRHEQRNVQLHDAKCRSLQHSYDNDSFAVRPFGNKFCVKWVENILCGCLL